MNKATHQCIDLGVLFSLYNRVFGLLHVLSPPHWVYPLICRYDINKDSVMFLNVKINVELFN